MQHIAILTFLYQIVILVLIPYLIHEHEDLVTQLIFPLLLSL